ncbi:ceramidase domain-containing protein [Thalassovita aquimarina]|uniref:Ceramidase domain-containing protein n=1 Tax=Thalassovita aquimarina TaxID=2785917 RepID=A0ABS5HU60_9RHOB|nr:ceramidase domain-containing protein [Thalassovita aquimarina]MBR9652512.1 ceramidase domain-containing protein [Thalassovita aquimarina]
MDWFRAVDSYCERVGTEYWAEPINALTNLGFVVAAALLWSRVRGLPLARALTVVLAVIGVGSWLFHTHAQVWAGVADSVPILVFVLIYIFAANRDFWRMPQGRAFAVMLLFFPFAAVTVPLFRLLPGLGASAGYAPVPLLIAIYAVLLRHRAPQTARRLGIGAAILCVSILFRSLDDPLCAVWPLGTHFVWHLLNATMLGWMIETYRRHMLAEPTSRR